MHHEIKTPPSRGNNGRRVTPESKKLLCDIFSKIIKKTALSRKKKCAIPQDNSAHEKCVSGPVKRMITADLKFMSGDKEYTDPKGKRITSPVLTLKNCVTVLWQVSRQRIEKKRSAGSSSEQNNAFTGDISGTCNGSVYIAN
jgi:hypothetical protein